MATSEKTVFEILNGINVNEHKETKNVSGTNLTYLSWCWAWAEVKKLYPDANYEIVKYDGIPYAYDPNTGYMVYTRVTIEGVTHEMWLPVMDGNNKAMKAEPYQYTTKYNGTKTVAAATMFDINKAIMRCLVKNLAMFGLGLYIYAGEDLPEDPAPEEQKPVEQPQPAKKPASTKKPAKAQKPSADPVTPAVAEFCNKCGCEIVDAYGHSAEAIANSTKKRLGKVYCLKCASELITKKQEDNNNA